MVYINKQYGLCINSWFYIALNGEGVVESEQDNVAWEKKNEGSLVTVYKSTLRHNPQATFHSFTDVTTSNLIFHVLRR
jgi:hypothetical protein